MNQKLEVYLEDKLVGFLQQEEGELLFAYCQDYLDGAKQGISLSLPLQVEPFKGVKVKAFFSGLLPEESVRMRLAKRLGLSEKNDFSLLQAVGGDCAGALALYAQGEALARGEDEVLDNAQLKEILTILVRRPMLAGDGYRLSLAGAQDKLAVGVRDGKIVLMKSGRPTTHILKPLIKDVKDSVYNEFFCMKLAKMVGIDTPDVFLGFAEEKPYYLIDRYDRQVLEDGRISRIHQEDFCQALGVLPEMKYECEGGPSVEDCLELLEAVENPVVARDDFIHRLLFNDLIGNSDAHAKNFSLLYKKGEPELAPAYDLLSTAIYPDFSEKMAMKIGGKYKPREIYRQSFYKLVPDTAEAKAEMDSRIDSTIQTTKQAALDLKKMMQDSGLVSEVFDHIINVIEKRSRSLLN